MLPIQELFRANVAKLAVCGVLALGFSCLPAQAQQMADAARKVRPRRVNPTPAPSPEATNHLLAHPVPFNRAPANKTVTGFFRKTEISGFMDFYYSFNFNRPFNRTNAGRSYDTQHNRLRLNLSEWVFEKQTAADSRLGFRFDVNFGASRDLIHAAEPGRRKVYRVLQQAYGSYLVPIGSGLQVDAGKFVTWVGAEVIETKDNWNYSRGYLFTSQPNYHLGVKARYAFNSKVSVFGALVNGWNNVEENNRGKSYGFALALTPTKKLSFTQNYIAGPEQPNNRSRKRQLYDTILSYNFSERFSVLSNYDYGFDTRADGRKVHWQGVSVAARYAPAKRIAVSPRLEWFDDRDGFTTGSPQRLREATLTGDYRVVDDLLLRVEYRRDWSNQPFFTARDPLAPERQQTTILGGLIYTFSSRSTAANAPDNAPTSPQPTPTP